MLMEFRQRLDQAQKALADSPAPVEADADPAHTYYAIERSVNLACLELRMPDGRHKAIPYLHFSEVSYEAETGIEIMTAQRRIRITGRNLTKLYTHLVAYRVRFIRANIGADTEEDGLFLEKIIIESLM